MNERIVVDVEANAQKFNQGINGVIQKLGGPGTLAIAGAAAAAGAAIAAFSVKGVQEFAKLETGMGEVFTLMPGMTEEAMNGMTKDVQDFADETGTLTGDVVPALYDSISAGVPKENVFDFLETANQLAVGGVTDLNTAVDGLTSSTNAYGSEILSATEAADIMFTGVKQGKTTIDQLSASVSETAPIAASLGVSFEDTTASLAAMTAQGEPTQKAATKLRQMMAELSDSTKGAGKTLKAVTDQTFPQFIAGGGTMQEALELIANDAEKHGGRVQDEFGSIEAGMAATMLTSDAGREQMGKNMEAMANSAGATGEAYDTMDATIGRAWDRMKAKVQTFTQDFGKTIAPIAGEFLNGAIDAFENFETVFFKVWNAVMNLFKGNTDKMEKQGDTIFASIGAYITEFRNLTVAVFNKLADLWDNVLKPAWDRMQPFVEGLLGAILGIFRTNLDLITDAMRVLTAFLEGDWKGAWEAMKALLTNLVTNLTGVIGSLWTGLKGSLEVTVNQIRDNFKTKWTTIKTNVKKLATDLKDAVTGTFNDLKTSLSATVETMRTNVTNSFTTLKDWLAGGFTTGVTNALTNLFDGFGDMAQGGFDAIAAGFTWLKEQTEGIMTALGNGLEAIAGGIGELVRNAFGNVVDWMTGQVNGLIDAVNGFIDRLNNALEIEIPSVSASLPDWVPGVGGREFSVNFPSINPPDIPPIPRLEHGGIVDSATLAMIGEAGPEAVIPLDRLGELTGGRSQTIIVELDGRVIAETTAENMPRVLRLAGA